MSTKTKPKSLAGMQAKADAGHEFEIMDDGEGTGMFFTVVGKGSSQFKTATRAQVNETRREQFEREAARKPESFQSVEEDIEKSIRTYAACVIAWRDVVIDEEADGPDPLPFTPENVRRALAYDNCRIQVEKEVLGLSDFTAG